MSSRQDIDETVRAYDLDALAYAAASAPIPDSVRTDVEAFAARLGPGARAGIAGHRSESWLELAASRA